MPLSRLVKYVPAPALIAALGLGLFAAGRCTAPTPAMPSRDSTAAATYARFADSVARESASRDSARNAAVDSIVDEWGKAKREASSRLVAPSRPKQPESSAGDSIAFLTAYTVTLEADNADLRATLAQTVKAADTAVAGLTEAFHVQQAETARLRGELTAAADSIRTYADKLGAKDREIHRLKNDRWSLCAAGGVGGTAGLAGTAQGAEPGGAIGGTLLVGACYRIW